MNLALKLAAVGVSVESADPVAAPEFQVVADQPQALENSVDEIQAVATTVDTLDSDLNQVQSAEDQLERIAGALECFQDGRGLNQTDFGVFAVAVESTVAGFGLRSNRPAVENFSGASARQAALNVALEDVKDKMASLKKWAIEMIKALMDFLANLWDKLFDGLSRLKARAEAIKARANDTAGRTNNTIKVPAALVANLSLGETVQRDLVGASSRLVQLVSAEINAIGPAQLELVDQLSEVVKSGADEETQVSQLQQIGDIYRKSSVLKWHKEDGKLVSDELLGGYGYVIDPAKAALNLSRTYPVHQGEAELTTLKPSQVLSVCDNLLDMILAVEKGKSKIDERQRAAKTMRAQLDALEGTSGGYQRHVRMVMNAQTRLLQGTAGKLIQFAVMAGMSMLKVAELSLDAVEATDVKALPA